MAEQKKLTVKEFKMWLQGVEEMQPDGWAPDARQWAKIREKIAEISEVVTVAAPQAEAAAMRYVDKSFGQPVAAGGAPSGNASAVPAGPSSLNLPAGPPPGPRQTKTASGLPLALASDQKVPAKTPDIDTSHGKSYSPPFV